MPKGIKECPVCSAEINAGYRNCPKCNHFFVTDRISVVSSHTTIGANRMSFGNGNNSYTKTLNEEMVREQSNVRANPDRETDHDKQVLQKAMLPNWFYLGRHQFLDHNNKAVGAATYNAYNPMYNNGTPISYSEFHMLVAAIVRIVDTGNPEGKRTKQKSSS